MQLQVLVYMFLSALKAIVTFTRAAGRPQELQCAIETFTCGTGNIPNLTSHCIEPTSTCLGIFMVPITVVFRWNYEWI